MSNNKRRLLSELELLRRYSDENHPLSEGEIKRLLNLQDISIANRKTIYEDIKTLIDYDYDVIFDTKNLGYFLEDAPFSLSEIKILCDSVSSLNDYDQKEELIEKISSFISIYQEEKIIDYKKNKNSQKNERKPGYVSRYSDKLLQVLKAINNNLQLEIIYNNKTSIICPYYLHFSNGKYYLYVKYLDNDKIYNYRLDRITYIKLLNDKYENDGKTIDKIKQLIKTSLDNYSKADTALITLSLSKPYDSLKQRLLDDFPLHYLDNKGNVVIEYKANEVFFSKLLLYGTDIKIKAPEEVSEAYINYLNTIIKSY